MLTFLINNYLTVYAEAVSYQCSFQDPATPLALGIIKIHQHIFVYLVLVFFFVGWMLVTILFRFTPSLMGEFNIVDRNYFFLSLPMRKKIIFQLQGLRFTHHTIIEVIWTILPSIILYIIAVPSFLLLYSMEEIFDPAITLKVIGHQWYWSYEYSDYKLNNFVFDSYMVPEDELEEGQLRLLQVDNAVALPIKTHVRVLVTSTDVLHCWAIPSLGIKIDAVPGRLNQGSIFLKRFGTFYGQCSEICGVNHGFMPISVNSVPINMYYKWLLLLV